eukprot:CAMPEP_0170621974 /NCGR_PEP_ID=MMETSP0224-20130122/28881_1 /TAXON_ID=285029 /ORGANISM="Togula jolla, Strain CCCM 725" /LENGTH=251 /DNA_ID=CAMNT_0010948257 /DNA_START=48 /DNA_END=803 /DNA_ORIENTATION=-
MEGQLEVTGPTLLAGMKPGASFDDFNVHLVRSKACSFAGLEIELKNDGYFTLVKAILENSLAAAWNASHGPEEQLMPGLRILNVNGVSGSSPQSVDELKNAKELKLTFRRMSPFLATPQTSLTAIDELSKNATPSPVESVAAVDIAPAVEKAASTAAQAPADALPAASFATTSGMVDPAAPEPEVETEEPATETVERVSARPCPVYTAELLPLAGEDGIVGDTLVTGERKAETRPCVFSLSQWWCCTTEGA